MTINERGFLFKETTHIMEEMRDLQKEGLL